MSRRAELFAEIARLFGELAALEEGPAETPRTPARAPRKRARPLAPQPCNDVAVSETDAAAARSSLSRYRR